MARRIIGVEGITTSDGRFLAHGCLTWVDEPLPIRALIDTTVIGHDGAVIVGKMTDLQRDVDGTISAEFHYAVPFTELPTEGPAFDLDDVTLGENTADIMRVTKARVRAVTIVPHPSWPDHTLFANQKIEQLRDDRATRRG